MLPAEDIKKIRNELDSCNNPLFLFDDDPDGLTSFLLFYRYKGEGNLSFVKASPELGEEYLNKVVETRPDKIFILDKPIVSQDFIDKVKVPVIWIDHHPPVKRNNVKYFNPRIYNYNDYSSTSRICYEVVKQDLWIAMVGITGDWQLTELSEGYVKHYPDLYSSDIKRPEDALFGTQTGKLVRIFSFILKGKTSEIKKYVNYLVKVKSPYEILEKQTKEGKYIYDRFEKLNKEYQKLLNEAKECVSEDKLLVYSYTELNTSFTSDLSNELLYLYPDKFIVVCRQKSGEMKCSLRYSKASIPLLLEKVFKTGVKGYGGGHEHAAGANIKEEDFNRFLEIIKRNI